MDSSRVMYKDGGIRQYDGFLGDPIWEQPDNESTYYDSKLDTQCTVPAPSIREIKEMLGLVGAK